MNENGQNLAPAVSPTPEVTQPPVETSPVIAPEALQGQEQTQAPSEGGMNAEVAQGPTSVPTGAVLMEQKPVEAEKPVKKGRKGLVIGLVVVAVLLIGGLVVWGLMSKDDAKDETANGGNSSEAEKPTEEKPASSNGGQNSLPVAAGNDESLEDELRDIRDAQRSNSLDRVVNAVLQHQVNNNGRLPKDGYIAPIREDVYGLVDMENYNDSSNTAATLIKNYLNAVKAEYNEFIDPDGTAFGLNIAVLDKGVEIGTVDYNYTIYIYKEAVCEGGKVVSSNSTRDYAVMYKLENGTVYCKGSN